MMRFVSRSVWFCLGMVMLSSSCSGSEATPLRDEETDRERPDGELDASKPRVDAGNKKDFSVASSTKDGGSTQSKKLALPSEVCSVLQKNGCTSCHKLPVAGGAPMPLQRRDDFDGKGTGGLGFAELMLQRIVDKKDPMPPTTSMREMLSKEDVATLEKWVEGGMEASAGSTPCAEPTDGEVVKPVTWVSNEWPAEGECDYEFTIGAHGAAGTPFAMDKTPFPIPAAKTSYECFYEYVPWGDTPVQAIAVRARVETPDDKKFVHHYVVSSSTGLPSIAGQAPLFNGDHKPCMNPSGSTVGVYAPGAFNPLQYPSDVGVIMPHGAGAYIELQVHYNNPAAEAGKTSRAQYDICVTKKKRANEAGVYWLGYENAFYETLVSGAEQTNRLDNQRNGSAIGKCSAKEKTRVLSIMPHMHEAGLHSKFEVLRKGGATDVVIDKPFDFEEQTSYLQEDLWLEPGDTVRTTCKWNSGPQFFGFGSEDEMCFYYVLAYPLTGLVANPLLLEKALVGGDLACAGLAGP